MRDSPVARGTDSPRDYWRLSPRLLNSILTIEKYYADYRKEGGFLATRLHRV